MRKITVLIVVLAAIGRTAAGQTSPESVTAGALRSYSTIHSIGMEWDLTGDRDHDASATVDYRLRGTTAWQSALPLVRVDYNGSNMLAGSLLFLTPGADYDIRLSLMDPDGGADARQITVSTRPVPRMPAAGPVFHVVPGTGGGDGSLASPFGGVAAAQAAAQPGDTFLLHAGDYGGRVRFDIPGTASSYIVWKAAGDGEVLVRGIDVAASHIWLEGIVVRDLSWALLSFNSPTNVVVRRCRFLNNANAIVLQGAGTNWYIADNAIAGNTPAGSGSLAGEGIDLNVTSGHTVAHNTITNVADGISYPNINVDLFGNDVFDVSDDGIELDNGRANVRVWGNRIHNAVHNGISFQPQSGAPWYIVRNQIVGSVEAAFKFRTTDRFVLLHNTVVHWGDAWPGTSIMCCNEWDLLKAYVRNNLWVSVQGGQIWGFEASTRDWRSDLDYDGFDWGTSTEPFSYGGVTYTDVWSFSQASGLEMNARQISRGTCFDDFRVPGPSPASVPPHVMGLQPGCEAVDSGVILPNINDGFAGSAPDRGAHEYGHPRSTYGPRPLATAAPAGPTGLTATAGAAHIDLRWTDASLNEAGFAIERSTAGQPFVRIGNVAPGTATYSDTSVAAGTEYAYRVAAYNEAGSSPYSNTASATVPAGCGAANEIELRWTDESTDEAGFSIERSTAGQPFVWIGSVASDTVSYTDTSVAAGIEYAYRVAAYNAAGTSSYSNIASATVMTGCDAVDEVVLYPAEAPTVEGNWVVTADASAAGGFRLQNPNAGAAKLEAPLASPAHYFELTFDAEAGKPYRLWVRGKALNNDWANDSLFAQFDGSVDASGAAVYRIGTMSATWVGLEECSGCGLAGWGWQDNGWGAGVLGPPIYFASTGRQRIRIQVREDGLGLDQIVLSAARYLTAAPGPSKNDTTILSSTSNAAPAVGLTAPTDGATFAAGSNITISATASDADGTVAQVDFYAGTTLLGTDKTVPYGVTWSNVAAGDYTLTAAVIDNAGARTASTAVRISVTDDTSTPADEIVLYAAEAPVVAGNWAVTADATAAGGFRLQNPNAGAAKLEAPLATPAHYFELTFDAEAGKPYRLWVRGKALNSDWANDSLFAQFDGSVDASGAAVHRIGTTSATWVGLEECSGCGLAGWGWQDNGWGAGVLGPPIYFAASGRQRIRIQVREDGLGLDQIVLSAARYLTAAPGPSKNDTTILPKTTTR
jgi:Bacterial Ig domain/Right handed beta helix region